MNNIRLNKEFNLDINEFFNVKYGFVNRLNPLVIYVTCKTWILPNGNFSYEKSISDVINKFKRKLKNKIINSSYLDNKFIYDEYINYSTMKSNKKNYFSFEIYLKRNENDDLSDLKNNIENMFKSILNELSFNLNNEMFSLTKSKK